MFIMCSYGTSFFFENFNLLNVLAEHWVDIHYCVVVPLTQYLFRRI